MTDMLTASARLDPAAAPVPSPVVALASPAPAGAVALPGVRTCRNCAHPIDWHHHLRAGTDCSRCGCEKVRGPFIVDAALAALVGMTALASRTRWRVSSER